MRTTPEDFLLMQKALERLREFDMPTTLNGVNLQDFLDDVKELQAENAELKEKLAELILGEN